MPQLNFFTIGLGVLLVIALVRQIFKRQSILQKWHIWIDAILFFGVFILLAQHFYEKRMTAGIIAVCLGAIAIGKYLYDKSKITGDDK